MKRETQGRGGYRGREPVAANTAALAALRLLAEGLAGIEAQRKEAIAVLGENAAEVDRAAAQFALTGVVQFFQDCGIESEPLVRLLGDLAALTAGSRPSPMLAPAATPHRPGDPPVVATVKGRLAAIMEFRQENGSSRRAASEWVARIISERMPQLRPVSRSAVDSWLVKWGGERGAELGPGREGYLRMRAILGARRPGEQDLKAVVVLLSASLPARESK